LSSFVAHDGRNLLASWDEWCAPICAEVGPDGAVWVLDWYSPVVQHNPTPRGFTTGKGNAYETPYRDKQHGRIWRIVWSDAAPRPAVDVAAASGSDLDVLRLTHPSALVRNAAARRMADRLDSDTPMWTSDLQDELTRAQRWSD